MRPEPQPHHEQDMTPPICQPCAASLHAAPNPSSEAAASQSDTGMDAVVNAVYMALKSCDCTHHVKVDTVIGGKSSTVISAQVQRSTGAGASSQVYDMVHHAKRALDTVAAQMQTVAVLGARVQKQESGYTLRSSIACMPEEAKDKMCWDMFQKGCCPRRQQCRWHHPEDSEIGTIKVSIRYAEETSSISSEQQHASNSSSTRRKISLGDLLF